jgi:hypothetical protein
MSTDVIVNDCAVVLAEHMQTSKMDTDDVVILKFGGRIADVHYLPNGMVYTIRFDNDGNGNVIQTVGFDRY